MGYQEIITIPLVDEANDVIFRAENAAPARIANPLAEDVSVMRSTGVVTMAAALEWNLNHGQRNIRLSNSERRMGGAVHRLPPGEHSRRAASVHRERRRSRSRRVC